MPGPGPGPVGLSFEAGALIACIIFMVYTASSGLFGVVYTDVLQFYMLILFVSVGRLPPMMVAQTVAIITRGPRERPAT